MIRKIRLASKLMTSQPSSQTHIAHTYCMLFTNQIYPITPFLSPPWIYANGLQSEFKPTGLTYGPIFSIRENTKTLQVQLFFSIKY